MTASENIEFAQEAVSMGLLSTQQIQPYFAQKINQPIHLWLIQVSYLSAAQIQAVQQHLQTKKKASKQVTKKLTKVPQPRQFEVNDTLGYSQELVRSCDFPNVNDTHSCSEELSANVLQAPENNSMFGHYQIQQELGQGGMGIVYKALDCKLNRVVALKLIKGVGDERQNKRFFQETSAVAQLNHPNITKLFEVGEKDRAYFFTMEYIEGNSLSSHIKQKDLKFATITSIIKKMASALQEAHSKGIIHRDIKPSNIMLTQDLEPKLMDFGLAKNTAEDSKLSKTGEIIGTIAYMPPEQAEGVNVNKKSDIYSLGATLYEALTGRPPFQGETRVNILVQVLTHEPIAPRTLNLDIPVDLETICLKCLEKSPKKRYSNAKSLAKDLQNFLEYRPILARPPSIWTHIGKFIWRNKLICSTVLGTTLALIAVIVGYLHITYEHNQKLIAQKNKVEQEKSNSLLTAKIAFEALQQVYWKDLNLQEDPVLLKGLTKVFSELKRLKTLDTLTEKNKKIMLLYGLVQGRGSSKKEVDKGIEVYNKLIAQNNKEAYVNRGIFFFRKGEFQKAQKDFAMALKVNPKDIRVYGARGRLYAHLREYAKALQDFTQHLKILPDKEIYLSRARVYEKLGKFNKAADDYNAMIKLDPGDSRSYSNLGLLYVQIKKDSLAEPYFKKAIKINPKDVNAYSNLGLYYTKKRLFNLAHRNYDTAIQIAPKNAVLYMNRGWAFYLQNNFGQAKYNYNKAIKLNPRYFFAYHNRALLFFMNKQYLLAKQDYDVMVGLRPNMPSNYAKRGYAYYHLKQYHKVVADWKKAISLGYPAQRLQKHMQEVQKILKRN